MPDYCIDGDRAYKLLKRLGSARLGGSACEREAAQVLIDEIRGMGLKPLEETFMVSSFADTSANLEVLSPFHASIACQVVGFSGSTPPGGIEAPLLYVESGAPCYLSGAEGKIVLVFGLLSAPKYKMLTRVGALGFLCIGKPARKQAELSMLEASWVKEWGRRPGVFISFDDGLRLIQEGAEKVRLTVKQREFEAESRNVMVDVIGAEYPEEIILIGAHFDSLRDTDGAHDNGAGTVVAMELLRHFVAHAPRRTLRFVWFGSEELGTLGSFDYVERHIDELDKIALMLNLDVGGGIIGQDTVGVMGPAELRVFFDLLNREMGLGLDIQEKVYGGDNIPFVKAGITAVAIYRSAGTARYIHTPDDRFDLVDGEHLASLAHLAVHFLERAANAYRPLFKREVPEAIQQDLKRIEEEWMPLKQLSPDIRGAQCEKEGGRSDQKPATVFP